MDEQTNINQPNKLSKRKYIIYTVSLILAILLVNGSIYYIRHTIKQPSQVKPTMNRNKLICNETASLIAENLTGKKTNYTNQDTSYVYYVTNGSIIYNPLEEVWCFAEHQ